MARTDIYVINVQLRFLQCSPGTSRALCVNKIWSDRNDFILLIYTDGERDGLWMACPFRTLVVLYRMFPFIICLILMNYLMEFYFIGFVNAHLPGCFCPWTFRLNIGLNTSPSDSFVSYLNSHLGYSAGEFQALQLIVLAVFGAVD